MADLYNVVKEVFAYDPSTQGIDGYVTIEFIGFHLSLEEAERLLGTASRASIENYSANYIEVEPEVTKVLTERKEELEKEYANDCGTLPHHEFYIQGNRLHHWYIAKSNKTSADIN